MFVEPGMLGGGREDGRECARARKRKSPQVESRFDLRELDQQIRKPKPIDSGPRGVPELALHVIDEARVPKLLPQTNALRLAKRRDLLRVKRCARLRNPLEGAMHAMPSVSCTDSPARRPRPGCQPHSIRDEDPHVSRRMPKQK